MRIGLSGRPTADVRVARQPDPDCSAARKAQSCHGDTGSNGEAVGRPCDDSGRDADCFEMLSPFQRLTDTGFCTGLVRRCVCLVDAFASASSHGCLCVPGPSTPNQSDVHPLHSAVGFTATLVLEPPSRSPPCERTSLPRTDRRRWAPEDHPRTPDVSDVRVGVPSPYPASATIPAAASSLVSDDGRGAVARVASGLGEGRLVTHRRVHVSVSCCCAGRRSAPLAFATPLARLRSRVIRIPEI